MKQATKNDQRLKDGGKPAEHIDAEEKVLVWPDLVYIELIAMGFVHSPPACLVCRDLSTPGRTGKSNQFAQSFESAMVFSGTPGKSGLF